MLKSLQRSRQFATKLSQAKLEDFELLMGNLTQKIRNQAPYVYQVKEQIAFIRCPDPAWKFN